MNPNHAAANILATYAYYLQEVAISRPGAMAMEVKALAEQLRATPAGPDDGAVARLVGALSAHTPVVYYSRREYIWVCSCGRSKGTRPSETAALYAARLHVGVEQHAALHAPAEAPPTCDKAGT